MCVLYCSSIVEGVFILYLSAYIEDIVLGTQSFQVRVNWKLLQQLRLCATTVLELILGLQKYFVNAVFGSVI